jgi:hypothetical protein
MMPVFRTSFPLAMFAVIAADGRVTADPAPAPAE